MAGHKPADIALPTDLPTLRNASIPWLLDAYNHLNHRPDIIQKAWRKCEAHNWNLSYECLTSTAARQRLAEVMQTNPQFAAEFANLDIVTGDVENEAADAAADDGPDDDLALGSDVLADLCLGSDRRTPASSTKGKGRQEPSDAAIGSDEEFIDSMGDDDFESVDGISCHRLLSLVGSCTNGIQGDVPDSTDVHTAGLPVDTTTQRISNSSTVSHGTLAAAAASLPHTPPPLDRRPGASLLAKHHPVPPLPVAPCPPRPNLSPAPATYLPNVSMSGGTNHTLTYSEEQLRITDKRGPKKMIPKKAENPRGSTSSGTGVSVTNISVSAQASGRNGAVTKSLKRKLSVDAEQAAQGARPPKLLIRIPPSKTS
ncbi:hypothetical protein FKP32DRAFT_1158739 [Trametes sanguinea]|nr:hypothetical protein FKP32DRAFT_1158739 [Trametes sanguinea]